MNEINWYDFCRLLIIKLSYNTDIPIVINNWKIYKQNNNLSDRHFRAKVGRSSNNPTTDRCVMTYDIMTYLGRGKSKYIFGLFTIFLIHSTVTAHWNTLVPLSGDCQVIGEVGHKCRRKRSQIMKNS